MIGRKTANQEEAPHVGVGNLPTHDLAVFEW